MMGPTHRLAGSLAGVAVSSVAGQPWSIVAMSGLVASATSHGWASPDIDQTEPWVMARRALPSPADRLLNHRALSHWWGLPVAAAWFAGGLPAEAAWPAWMLIVGWSSHLVGDFVFGKIPVLPFPDSPTVGLGLDTGGFLETGRVRSRTVIPFGPARVLIVLGIVVILAGGLHGATTPAVRPSPHPSASVRAPTHHTPGRHHAAPRTVHRHRSPSGR
jgi:hypothetical protein